eukprot:186347-Chlamydomonas_euryale.AAC.1
MRPCGVAPMRPCGVAPIRPCGVASFGRREDALGGKREAGDLSHAPVSACGRARPCSSAPHTVCLDTSPPNTHTHTHTLAHPAAQDASALWILLLLFPTHCTPSHLPPPTPFRAATQDASA